MEIKPGKFVVLTYDLYAGAGEPEETLMMRATDEMPDQFVFGVDQNILPSMLKRLEGLKQGLRRTQRRTRHGVRQGDFHGRRKI